MFNGMILVFFIALLQYFNIWQSLYIALLPIFIILVVSIIFIMIFRDVDQDSFDTVLTVIANIFMIVYILFVFLNINITADNIKNYLVKETNSSYIIKFNNKFYEIKKDKNKQILEIIKYNNIKNFKVLEFKGG